MPSIFPSHTSINKPFVEKLANGLKSVGVNVWFDKWEIKVGESITWKIEHGIRENEFLGIVLSPEALNSEWVKSELGAGWVKQMSTRKVVVLPILYRDCDIPLFLRDRKYADFRSDYQSGFSELAAVLGIKHTEAISEDNWRKFVRVRGANWQKFRETEFEKLVTILVNRAIEYNWSTWVAGKKKPYSITLTVFVDKIRRESITIKLMPKTHAYLATLKDAINPNDLTTSDFVIYVGLY